MAVILSASSPLGDARREVEILIYHAPCAEFDGIICFFFCLTTRYAYVYITFSDAFVTRAFILEAITIARALFIRHY